MATKIVREKSGDPRTALLARVRALMATGKGPANFLGTLDDAALHGVYSLVRQGSASRAIARWLHERGVGLDSSEDSLSRGVTKFRARIAPLLVGPSVPEAPGPKPSPLPMPTPRPARELTDLQNVSELVRRYDSVIKAELADAEAGGALSPNLSRHVAALNSLLKTKDRLEEKRRKEGDAGFTPEEEREAQAAITNLVNTLPDRGARLIEAGREFIKLIGESQDAVELEQLPDGSFTEVEPPRREPDIEPDGSEDNQPEWAKYLP